ncbi:imm11 family protein [Bradyrhizobium sp. HKCCYLRH3099]|uniref:imm11 family protein n=1 Tax=unclassified Bradyrhizobium TaxID=2631580 RepID=UPI003EB8DFAD
MARFLLPENPWMYTYGADALDGDVDKIAFEEPVAYALELYRPWRGFGGGARVSSCHMPTRLRLRGRKRKLVDFDNQFHMLLVSRRFLDLVEGLQKDIQYFPVECIWRDGSEAGQFYFFFTTVLRDAVNREKTNATWAPTPRGGLWQPKPGEIFAFDKDRIGGMHMWVDPHMPTKGPLVTEELFKRLKGAEIRSFYDAPLYAEI